MKRKTELTAIAIAVFLILAGAEFQAVQAQYPLESRIGASTEGFVSGPNLHRQGDTYTLTGNISKMIDIRQSNIIIDGAGFTIEHNATTHDNEGIFIRSQNNVTIKNVVIKNSDNGIYGFASNSLITQCIIENCSNAISLHESSGNTISNNTLLNNEDGFTLAGNSTNNLFTNNTLNGNEWPFGTMDIALHNTFTVSNKINGKSTYCIANQTDLVISPAAFPDIGYLSIVNSTGITIRDLTISDNPAFTLTLINTTNSNIINNTITNTWRALYLKQSDNNRIVGNYLANNWQGIFLFEYNNIITGNTIQNNTRGISFASANSVGTPNETVYHNNFINNKEHVSPFNRHPLDFMPAPPESYWDNGSEGNFWSNYNGTDINGDGIGETAYLASNYYNITDRFPLTKPYLVAINPPIATSPPPLQSPEPVASLSPSSPTQQPTLEPTQSANPTTPPKGTNPYLIIGIAAAVVVAVTLVGLAVYFKKYRQKITAC
jgi:parallel beta-helix repeat protein